MNLRKTRRTRAASGGLLISLAVVCGAPARCEGSEVFHVDPEASRVRVHLGRAGMLKFLGHDHEIEAPIAAGRIVADPADPTRSMVDIRFAAPLLAIVPGTEPAEDILEVEEKMRGPEVLDAERYPGVRFWSFEIGVEEADRAAGLWRLGVRGGLELKGARHRVEVPMLVRLLGDDLVTTGEIELRLRRLGVAPPSVGGVVKVADRFRVTFEVRARRGRRPGGADPVTQLTKARGTMTDTSLTDGEKP